jgi:hypothetical protein
MVLSSSPVDIIRGQNCNTPLPDMQLCMDACAGLAALHTRGLPHPDLAARTCVLNRYRGDATFLHQSITQKMAVGSEDRSSYKGSEFELGSNNDKILRFDQNEVSVVHKQNC